MKLNIWWLPIIIAMMTNTTVIKAEQISCKNDPQFAKLKKGISTGNFFCDLSLNMVSNGVTIIADIPIEVRNLGQTLFSAARNVKSKLNKGNISLKKFLGIDFNIGFTIYVTVYAAKDLCGAKPVKDIIFEIPQLSLNPSQYSWFEPNIKNLIQGDAVKEILLENLNEATKSNEYKKYLGCK